MATTIAKRWDSTWVTWHSLRREMTWERKIALALGMAALTGLLAQIRIPLWPVPITGQTLAVLLSGVLLGRTWGGTSQVLYVALGAVGVPWFARQAGGDLFSVGGYQVLLGATGGYLIGFILAALFIGHIVDKSPSVRRFVPMLGLAAFGSFVLIYVPGLIQLGLWLHFVKGNAFSLHALMMMGCVPFLVGDAVKTVVAACVGTGIAPRNTPKA